MSWGPAWGQTGRFLFTQTYLLKMLLLWEKFCVLSCLSVMYFIYSIQLLGVQ